MTPRAIRAWSWAHKWSSLICTAFLLMLCVTGLPLIFHDEIDAALNPDTWQPANPGGPLLDLDTLVAGALADRPGEVAIYLSFDTDRPVVNLTSGASTSVPGSEMAFTSIDRTSGEIVPPADVGESVMHFIEELHVDMFLGLPGMLFLGFMGLLFAVAIVSGVVLYAPFMRKLDFGAVRTQRSSRTRWLDLHNLLGVVTVGWALVVGLTGTINTLEQPIVAYWRETALADLIENADAGKVTQTTSLDRAVAMAQRAASDLDLQFIAFPGSTFSTEGHYGVFLRGRTPLTERIITPVLIHAATGRFDGVRYTPWYVKTLSVSRPLHFGDYGGIGLKIVWAILDIVTIIVLASGLYLWAGRGRRAAGTAPA